MLKSTVTSLLRDVSLLSAAGFLTEVSEEQPMRRAEIKKRNPTIFIKGISFAYHSSEL